MPKVDAGKEVEAKVMKWLDAKSNADIRFAYHRYPDARAARGALSAQPADFLVARLGQGATHLEVKETAQSNRLPKAKIGQYGVLKKFRHAGIPVLVIVYRSESCTWTYFTGDDLFGYETVPASFPFITGRDYLMVDDILKRFFNDVG